MKETLRRYPPLPVIPRVATASFEFGGYRIPAGAMVVRGADPHPSHGRVVAASRSASIPSASPPARAEDERHTHSWVPFGGGAAPLHRAALRGGAGEGDHAPARAALPLERPARLHDARAAGADLEAARRAADPAPKRSDSRARGRGAAARRHLQRDAMRLPARFRLAAVCGATARSLLLVAARKAATGALAGGCRDGTHVRGHRVRVRHRRRPRTPICGARGTRVIGSTSVTPTCARISCLAKGAPRCSTA